MTERASLDELLEFANKVREAGGGAVLHALMPAVPEDPKACLVAANLNFNCWVQHSVRHNRWAMFVEDEELAARIADAIGEPYLDEAIQDDAYSLTGPKIDAWAIRLPERIGLVAEDFDAIYIDLITVSLDIDDWENLDEYEREEYSNSLTEFILRQRPDLKNGKLEEMWPYISQSIKEAHNLGFINDEGKLVL